MASVTVEGLGKSYRMPLGPDTFSKYRTLRDALAGLGRRARRGGAPEGPKNAAGPFWALRDLSFQVEPGTVLGIVGHNGAGKSTLLKLLSRITRPTEGLLKVRGRIGSLLEVGTGFHPELSGRANIFLNGAILGMARKEVQRQFGSIVEFSGVGAFLDVPVKRYSSGMYVRLAFAVAAHFDAEVLLIDEVLAVGDAEYQRRCLERVRELCNGGRTVLFVSHNLAAVQNLCDQGLLLERGRAAYQGGIGETIKRYVQSLTLGGDGTVETRSHPSRQGGSTPIIMAVRLRDEHGRTTGLVASGAKVALELDVEPPPNCPPLQAHFYVEDALGQRLFTVATELSPGAPTLTVPGRLTCDLGELALKPGRYLVSAQAMGADWDPIDSLNQVMSVDVFDADYFGTGQMPRPEYGPMLVRSHWRASTAP